jgi:hypothetical protein
MHKFGLLPDGLHLGYECFDADVCDKVKDEINISALPRHQKNTHEDDIEIVTDWYTLMDHSEKYGLLRKYLQSGDNNAETVKGYSKALQDIVITHMQHFAEWINANT